MVLIHSIIWAMCLACGLLYSSHIIYHHGNCMKEAFFMLSMLIPGPNALENKIDVFLHPLIHDLKELLWEDRILRRMMPTWTRIFVYMQHFCGQLMISLHMLIC